LEPTSSTNISYCVFIFLKSLPPGALEKSSITDQKSTPPAHEHVVQLRADCFVQTLDGLRIVCV
jgi:hypothetical protein